MRVKVPRKSSILTWLLSTFGGVGAENYGSGVMSEVLTGLQKILSTCGSVELEQLGKLLIFLSNNPSKVYNFTKEIENYLGGEDDL